MDATFQVVFEYDPSGDALSLTRVLPGGERDTSPVDIPVVRELEKRCADFAWHRSSQASVDVGKRLFDLLDGDRRWLARALEEAETLGVGLCLDCQTAGPAANLPFEALYRDAFSVPVRGVHVVRRICDRGCRANPQAVDRPLRMLFMACSPDGTSPVLDFEKEEEAIYEATNDLAVEVDVEDTGSLDGLASLLANGRYDVVHLSGHADIGEDGVPFFWMEDDEGRPVRVRPSRLWETLSLSPPRLVFLSGCRTGETTGQASAVSFAQHLVASHCSTVLGWGLPVSDRGASLAAERLYFELSRGETIPDAVLAARRALFKRNWPDWSLLRLFSDGTPLGVPLVLKGQKKRVKARDLQYTYLLGSQVKVLKRGFIGRRKQLQAALRCLRGDEQKAGLLLHGTGGLGKSCLAGKLCDRLKDHTVIVVHGRLADTTLSEALKDAFMRADDRKGLEILDEKREMPDRIRMLCSSSFQQRSYLILLDDFEQNLEGVESGRLVLRPEAVGIVTALLRYLPYSGRMTPLVITSRYEFPLTVGGEDLVQRVLEPIGLTSFRGADERKKAGELHHITGHPDASMRRQLIAAGRGNPRLMEAIDTLVAEVKGHEAIDLLVAVKDEQDEFVQELVLRRILDHQPAAFQRFVRQVSVYRRLVLERGISLACAEAEDWRGHLGRGVALSIIERDSRRTNHVQYWVTPLLREEMFDALAPDECAACHEAAVRYWRGARLEAGQYDAVAAAELIDHALRAGLEADAVEEAGPLLTHLRKSLAYAEAQTMADKVLDRVTPTRTSEYSRLLFETGWICNDLGESKKAIGYYEKALAIDKAVYGDKHPSVAARLSNLGSAWGALGDAKKAIAYYEEALAIDKAVYGDKHPSVAGMLNNLGEAWRALGDAKKAIAYYEEALAIDKTAYGDKHPSVASMLNNLGLAWCALGDAKKAIAYFEEALAIDKAVYGDKHPSVAIRLSNLGEAWRALGDAKKAIAYYEEALAIGKAVYGDKHPFMATVLNNLGSAWCALGDAKKAIAYIEESLAIDKAVYGDKHPSVARDLNNLGTAYLDLGDKAKARRYFEEAQRILLEVYGADHPHTKTVKRWLDSLGG